MVVLVTGSVNEDGVTGTASHVVFDRYLVGPVETLERNLDGDSMLITVLGVSEVELEGTVTGLTVTLQLAGGTVRVQLDNRTLLEDDTEMAEPMTIDDIRTGDFLEVEAFMVGDSLVATRIDRDEPDDDVIQAPVESFTVGNSITLLGITYSTQGAEFENQDDMPLSSEQFYAAVQVGALVKVKDEEVPDGVADEVEFEFEGSLDGGREFEDDSDEQDESDDSDESDESDEPIDPNQP